MSRSLLKEDSYRSLQRLQEGTFSAFFKVKSVKTGKEYAGKEDEVTVVNFYLIMRDFLLKRFPDNPYFLVPYDFTLKDEDNSLKVQVVYDLYEGDLIDLTTGYIGEPAQKARLAIDLYRHLVKAIYCLLDNGIYHNDIKPENIVYRIREEGADIKLIDFGLSFLTPCLPTNNLDFKRLVKGGTAGYAPREQMTRSFYSANSMFYSLAMTIYIFITQEYQIIDEDREERHVGRVFSFLPYEQGLTEEEKDIFRQIENLINVSPDERVNYLPPRPPNLEFPSNVEYSTPELIADRIREFFNEDDANNLKYFAEVVHRETTASHRYPLGSIEYIKVISCLSRYLVHNPFYLELIPQIIALIRTEVHNCSLFADPKECLEILAKLNFVLFDCRLSPAFFCLKNHSQVSLEQLFTSAEPLPDIFSAPEEALLQVILRLHPSYLRDCEEPRAYENLLRPAGFYF